MASLKELEKEVNVLDLEESFKEACLDKEFVNLVKALHLNPKEAMKKTSQLVNSLEEKKNCQECKGLYMCKNAYPGCQVIPEVKEGSLYFTYKPCKYQQQVYEKEKEQNKNKNEIEYDFN